MQETDRTATAAEAAGANRYVHVELVLGPGATDKEILDIETNAAGAAIEQGIPVLATRSYRVTRGVSADTREAVLWPGS